MGYEVSFWLSIWFCLFSSEVNWLVEWQTCMGLTRISVIRGLKIQTNFTRLGKCACKDKIKKEKADGDEKKKDFSATNKRKLLSTLIVSADSFGELRLRTVGAATLLLRTRKGKSPSPPVERERESPSGVLILWKPQNAKPIQRPWNFKTWRDWIFTDPNQTSAFFQRVAVKKRCPGWLFHVCYAGRTFRTSACGGSRWVDVRELQGVGNQTGRHQEHVVFGCCKAGTINIPVLFLVRVRHHDILYLFCHSIRGNDTWPFIFWWHLALRCEWFI